MWVSKLALKPLGRHSWPLVLGTSILGLNEGRLPWRTGKSTVHRAWALDESLPVVGFVALGRSLPVLEPPVSSSVKWVQ